MQVLCLLFATSITPASNEGHALDQAVKDHSGEILLFVLRAFFVASTS